MSPGPGAALADSLAPGYCPSPLSGRARSNHDRILLKIFSDEVELAQLRRLHETLQLEIIAVLESLNRLRESPDFELCQLSEQKPGMLDELAAERTRLLEKECAKLEKEAERLAEEMKELSGRAVDRIA